ncbi:uncharacterized protein BT62DRAFT_920850 [Guyanagaster necrorhizus]|uniref:Uncharacterized protein n=1 Tax=Guyanagaster necrorhizus TaxID=856835 RepID=A0A9P7VSD6_9AGAR|nr:uncharacterized protein BT62DRAFT_920850 [Guyanagaster necrorhizus MCA 3950]KAG7445106.1 hypothetical protein BT62DRAFT_920850 [Guyanagaster necrorhizus MCA 3950]
MALGLRIQIRDGHLASTFDMTGPYMSREGGSTQLTFRLGTNIQILRLVSDRRGAMERLRATAYPLHRRSKSARFRVLVLNPVHVRSDAALTQYERTVWINPGRATKNFWSRTRSLIAFRDEVLIVENVGPGSSKVPRFNNLPSSSQCRGTGLPGLQPNIVWNEMQMDLICTMPDL